MAMGIHAGLAIVCFSAVYTRWQTALVTYPQWAVMLLVAAALLYTGFHSRRDVRLTVYSRSALALAGLLVWRLACDPQLEAIPLLADELPDLLLACNPGIALIGVLVAFLCWWGYLAAGGELGLGIVPFRRSAALAVLLLAAIAMFNYFMLRGPHDLPADTTLLAVLTVAQAGALTAVLLGIGGGRGIRRAPHIYLAVTLIAAFVRNVFFAS